MRFAWVLILAGGATSLFGQTDWPVYLGEPTGTRYSPLTDISAANVAKLEVAWKFDTGEIGGAEVTPIEVQGVLYFTTPKEVIVALDADSGRELWRYDPKIARSGTHRGVSYWPGDKSSPPRVIVGTSDGRLLVLDAKTGKAALSFGDNGEVNLRTGVTEKFPDAPYSASSPPAIYRNLAILGPRLQEGPDKGPNGHVRAFDILTGKEVWRFNLVPEPGEPGNETWGPEGWKDRSGPGAWGGITVDTARGMVFVPTGQPGDSFYGADRPGKNLYSSSVLALDANTGKLRWYFQLVHHDIFDFDTASPPALIDVVHNGRKIPAVAQVGKHGLLFILERETGKSIYGVEERPVPKSDVPGEESWPTQPFPLKPPPLARMSVASSELNRTTPETAKACEELFQSLRHEGPFTPYSHSQRSLLLPSTSGGANWYDMAFDPKLGYLVGNISNSAAVGHMIPRTEGQLIRPGGGPAMPYTNETGYTPSPAGFRDPNTGRPCYQPPWGELVAVNTNTGDIAWRVPLGIDEEMEARGIMNTGTVSVGGPMVTAGGLIFIGGTADRVFRAFDTRTGKLLWSFKTEGAIRANPMSYKTKNGKQYVMALMGSAGQAGGRGAAPGAQGGAGAGRGGRSSEPPPNDSSAHAVLVAFALPSK